MDAVPIRLADLIARGMYSAGEAGPAAAAPWRPASSKHGTTPARTRSPGSEAQEAVAALLGSTRLLAQKLERLTASRPEDAADLRRDVLLCIERFIVDISSKSI